MKVEKCYYCYVNAILSLETSMGKPSNSMFAHFGSRCRFSVKPLEQ